MTIALYRVQRDLSVTMVFIVLSLRALASSIVVELYTLSLTYQ